MRTLVLIVAVSAFLAGCAGGGGYAGRGYADPYRTQTGSISDSSAPVYDDRYWPPVVPGQAFPPQIMDGGSQD